MPEKSGALPLPSTLLARRAESALSICCGSGSSHSDMSATDWLRDSSSGEADTSPGKVSGGCSGITPPCSC